MKQNFSCWGRRTGLLARAVLLSLAAGFLAGTAQAADFTKPITGDSDADYAGVKSGLTYNFTGDNTITPDTDRYQAGIDYSRVASGSTLNVNNTGKLSMNVSGSHQMMLDGIMNKSPNTININGDIDVKVNNTKEMGKSYGIYAWNTTGAKVDVIGNADISVTAKNIAHGVDVSSANGWIDLEGKSGGTIRITADKTAKNSAAVSATGDSTHVNINYDRGSIRNEDATVQINGDLYTRKVPLGETEYTTGESGTIYLGLAGKDSYLHGTMGYRADGDYDDYEESGTNYYSGDVYLLMKNGASWTNEAYASHTGEEWTSWAGSKAAYLESDGGVIYQKDTNPITIDSYKGNVTVVYDHDASDPAKFAAGDFKISYAQPKSTVTMLTSSTGLSFDPKTDKTNAAKVLSALAQKLYYTGTSGIGNLTGTVAIASGLTSSTFQVSGPIQFSTATTGTKVAGQGYFESSDADTALDAEGTMYLNYNHDNGLNDNGPFNGYVKVAHGDPKNLIYDFGKKTVNITATQENYDTAPIGSTSSMGVPNGVTAHIKAGTLNLTMLEQSTLAYSTSGILVDTGNKITIDSDVNMHVSGGNFSVAGINMGHFGSGAGSQTSVIINGDLSAKGTSDNQESNDYWGVQGTGENGGYDGYKGSRWAPSGIYMGSENGSSVTVNGKVNLAVKGNGVVTDAYTKVDGKNSLDNFVTIRGGTIDTPAGGDVGFFSLASFGGTINMGMNDALSDAGTSDVVLKGNVLAMKDDGNAKNTVLFRDGAINIGLGTRKSSWTGVVSNTGAAQAGDVNLYMKDGSVWNHEAYSPADGINMASLPDASDTTFHMKGIYGTYDGVSHINKLSSNGGIIYQNEKDTNIEVADYSGDATVVYKNSSNKIDGGDFIIKKAADNSKITLFTGSQTLGTGYKADDVLNKLANKLYYMAGDGKLTGTVKIAEGLTSSSATTGDIKFSTATSGTKKDGQGYYGIIPSGEVKTGPIMTSENIGETRQADGDGTASVYIKDKQPGVSAWNNSDIAMYPSKAAENDITVNLEGHNLKLGAGGSDEEYVQTVYVKDNGKVNITNSKEKGTLYVSGGLDSTGKIVTKASHVYGIFTDDRGKFTAGTDVVIDGVKTPAKTQAKSTAFGVYDFWGSLEFDKNLTIKNVSANNAAGMYLYNINGDKSNHVVIKGNLDIENIDGHGITAKGITMNTAGGKIHMLDGHNYFAINNDKSTINLNGGDGITSGILNIYGDFNITSNDTSVINMNLTKESSWTGSVINAVSDSTRSPIGHLNMTMADGSSWTHETGHSQSTGDDKFSGANVSKLSTSKGSTIYQNSNKPITIFNYSGDTTVVYKHDSTDPTKINGGDFTIKNAAADSRITLVTGSEGITSGFKDTDSGKDRNTVSAVLNKLANKLFYSNYAKDKNLSGTVRIAEGLTASSASAKVGKEGSITFSDGSKEGTTAGQGYYDYTPASDVVYKTGPITTSEKISETRKSDEGGLVTVEATTPNAENGGLVSTLYAVGEASKAAPMVVDMDGKELSLSAASDSKIAASVYVTDNAHIQIKNEAGKKLFIKSSNTDTRAADGIFSKGTYSDLSIQGPVEIKNITTEGSSASGIAVNGKSSEVHMDGPLTIAGVEGKNTRGMGISTAGIGIVGDYSKVTVNGNVDITGVTGSSLKTSGTDSEISVGGGTITAAEDAGKNHNYYAARVDKGTININMKDGKAGSSTTKITGDMYATRQYGKRVVEYSGGELVDWTNAGKLNVALTDSGSFWTGVAAYDQYNDDYGTGGNTMHDIGEVNLYLQNGATWTNEQQSHVTTTTLGKDQQVWKGSQLATLHGGSDSSHAGIIYQKDTNPITVLDYSGTTKVFYSHDESDPKNIIGGDFKITKAEEGSQIELITDRKGINAEFNDSDGEADKTLVAEVMDKLANKLYYSGYADGYLAGTVKITSGLTASSAEMKTGDISFYNGDEAKVAGMTEGQGHYIYKLSYPDEQQTDKLSKVILGFDDRDTYYKEQGILKSDGIYHFTKPETTISVDGAADSAEQARALVYGDNWVAASIYSAISGARPQKNDAGEKISANGQYSNVVMDLGGNKLNVDVNWTGGGTGIAAIGHASKKELNGSVEIKNAGAMSVDLKTGGLSAALFANRGGKITIHNGGGKEEYKVLKLRASSKSKGSAAVIKTMNGNRNAVTKDNTQSEITIDGLVDVLADGKADANGYASNEAVSAVASTINIGGGKIIAKNGAWAAVRAYGEFVTSNYGIVNINAEDRVYGPDKEGSDSYVVKDFNIGKRNVVLEGDVVTNGGMGTKGQINVGLNGASSHWIGNYADTRGYGVTQGMLGSVNIKAKDGAYWKGFGNGSMNVSLTGKDTYWLGFNISQKGKMQLSLNDGATWYNAITKEQKDQDGKAADAYIGYLSGNNGVIDMTGANVFVASSSSLSGNPVKEGDTSITESRNGVTGDVNVDSYSGSHTVVYRHEIVDDAARAHADLYGDKAASVIGGDFKITDAAAGSTITLVTDSTGVSTTSTAYTDKNLVNDLLDKLANKLYYSGYANGNLKGYVRIAEGLTSSSITKALQQGDISFYNADEAKAAGMTEGQGHYSYSLVYPDEQVKDPMATVIDGSRESKDAYRDAGIYKDKTDTYDFTKKPATVNTDGKSDSIIHAGDNDVNVKTNDVLNINAKDGGIGMKAENGKTVTTTGNTNITAKDGTGILADKGIVKLANDTTISAGTGMEAKNGGTITAEGKANITATGNALHADGDGSAIALKDGTISGKVLAENKGTITTNGAAITGDVTAASDGTVSLVNGSTSAGVTADGGTVSTDGTTVDGFISAKNGGTASMKNGSAKGLSADKDSTITATLDKGDAKLDGNVANEGTATVSLSNGASWTGDSTGTGTTTANIGSGSTWTGASTNEKTKVDLEGIWKQTGDSKLGSLTAADGSTVDKTNGNSGNTEISHFAGNVAFLYSHDESDPTVIHGGAVTIGTADKGSEVNMVTDSKGMKLTDDHDGHMQLNKAFDALAHKLNYHGNRGNLTGRVKIAEGLTSSAATLRTGDISFKDDGTGFFDYSNYSDYQIEYGSDETRMMKGTKSALLGSAMMWRSNNNDIQRRMGDLRLGQGETGVWARYMGGKNKFDQQNTYLNQDYDIGQAGFDKKVGDWTVGFALDHGDGKSHYIGGKGKEKMNTLAIYGTRVSNDGKYFDVIVKTGQVKNKFDVSNEIGNKLHGDYKAWGNSISLEYGKRFVQDSGFYMDPSMEFTAGRLNGKNFKGTSDLGTLYVHQHGFNSAIGRVGFSIGRQLPKSNLYAKFALAHEFAGNFKTDFYADDGGLKSTKVDLGDTWLDMELGGSLSLGKNVYLYGTYTRTFEADMATKWRADVGVRYTF